MPLPATRRSVAVHELRHAYSAIIAAKLFHPDLFGKLKLLISVADAEHGECAQLGIDQIPMSIQKELAALATVGPITLGTATTVKSAIKNARFANPEYLSEPDIAIQKSVDVDPAKYRKTLAGTYAYLKLLGSGREDKVATVILNASPQAIEIKACDLCPTHRLDEAVSKIQPLLRAVDLNNKWTGIVGL